MFFDRILNNNRISPENARELMEKGEARLVDVRTPGEYAQGHIEGSVLVPLDRLAFEKDKKIGNPEKPVIVYCLSGNRSSTAARMLIKAGYKKVHDLGGIYSWPYGLTSKT